MIDRQSLYGAVIDCPHTIEENKITLRFDSSKPGNNTLDQLGSRLEALASSQGAAIPNAAKLAELIPQEATILPGEPRKVCMTLPQLREFASAITGAPMAPHGTEEDAYVIERLGMLLAGVAVALKGPEKAMHRHGYEDLPELAAKLMLEVELHRALPPAAAGSALAATNAQLATIVQAAGVSLEPHIDTLPALKAAFVHIAYDNGMVDRAQPEPTVLNDMLQRVRLSFSSQQVEQVNAELAALTSEVLEQVCTEDLAALDPKPISDLADRLLNVAFDDEPPAIDYRHHRGRGHHRSYERVRLPCRGAPSPTRQRRRRDWHLLHDEPLP